MNQDDTNREPQGTFLGMTKHTQDMVGIWIFIIIGAYLFYAFFIYR